MTISLLTDFGSKDGYVGAMKGVISTIAPNTEIIDLTHETEPFNILQGGFILDQSYRYFPKGTIFVAVVDPGVGSERKPILIQTENYYFIGPDNGIFSLVLSEEKIKKIIHLQNSQYFLNSVSSTFHGRDLFAPVAAHLSQGIALDSFGPTLKNYEKLEEFFPKVLGKKIEGKILSIDRFGNVITNISKSLFEKIFEARPQRGPFGTAAPLLKIGKKIIRKIYSHYAEGKKGEVFLLFGSSGFLEIAMNEGSAAKTLKAKEYKKIILQ